MTRVVERLGALALMLGALACTPVPAPPARAPGPPQPQQSPGNVTEEMINHGVVAVRATGQSDNYRTPWTKQTPWTHLGTGLVVKGRRILVGGRMLDKGSFIEVQRFDGVRRPAHVVLHDAEANLTLLAVDGDDFWAPLVPLNLLPSMPRTGRVVVVRRPADAAVQASTATIRTVTGVVLSPGWGMCLGLEIEEGFKDASGSEIVLTQAGVAGILTLQMEKSSIVTGSPALRYFLAEAARPQYRGFAELGISVQGLRDPQLREQLGLAAADGGIRVQKVFPNGSAAGHLEPGDVLLDVDGAPIDANGRIAFGEYGRVPFVLLLTAEGHYPGSVIEITVLRGQKRHKVSFALKRVRVEDPVVPTIFADREPEYAVHGGLVFQSLTQAYLWNWGPTWQQTAPPRLLIAPELSRLEPTPGKKRVIILSHVLPDPANLGYEKLRDLLVASINGVPVETINDVRSAFRHPAGAFDVVELQAGQRVRRLVLDAAQVEAAQGRLTETYGRALSAPQAPAASTGTPAPAALPAEPPPK